MLGNIVQRFEWPLVRKALYKCRLFSVYHCVASVRFLDPSMSTDVVGKVNPCETQGLNGGLFAERVLRGTLSSYRHGPLSHSFTVSRTASDMASLTNIEAVTDIVIRCAFSGKTEKKKDKLC